MLRNLLWEYLNEFFFKWWLFNWIIYVISICIIYIWDFFLKIKNASKYYFKLYIRSNFFCMFIGLRWITRIFYDEIIEWKYRNNRKLIIFFYSSQMAKRFKQSIWQLSEFKAPIFPKMSWSFDEYRFNSFTTKLIKTTMNSYNISEHRLFVIATIVSTKNH